MKNSGGEENTLAQPSSSTSHLQNRENFEMKPRRSYRARVGKDFGPNYYYYYYFYFFFEKEVSEFY